MKVVSRAPLSIFRGDYHLTTQVVIDISYLKIAGSGHGFTSSSIRFNTPESELANWHEVWPGAAEYRWAYRRRLAMRSMQEPHFMFSVMAHPELAR